MSLIVKTAEVDTYEDLNNARIAGNFFNYHMTAIIMGVWKEKSTGQRKKMLVLLSSEDFEEVYDDHGAICFAWNEVEWIPEQDSVSPGRVLVNFAVRT